MGISFIFFSIDNFNSHFIDNNCKINICNQQSEYNYHVKIIYYASTIIPQYNQGISILTSKVSHRHKKHFNNGKTSKLTANDLTRQFKIQNLKKYSYSKHIDKSNQEVFLI